MNATSNDAEDALLDPRHFDPLTNREFVTAAAEMLLATNDQAGLFALKNAVGNATAHAIEAAQQFVLGNVPSAMELWNMRPDRPMAEKYVSATSWPDGTCGLLRADGVLVDLSPVELRAWLLQMENIMLQRAARTSQQLQ